MTRIQRALALGSCVFVFAMMSAQTTSADSCCWTCSNGICVAQATGQPGFRVCISDPVGCWMNASTRCTAGPDNGWLCSQAGGEVLSTLSALYRVDGASLDQIFPAGTNYRVLRGIGRGFDCSDIAQRLVTLGTPGTSMPELSYWHFSTGRGPNVLGAVGADGVGYLFRATESWGERSQLNVFAAQSDRKAQELANESLSGNDVLLVRVTAEGSDCVLAMSARQVPETQLVEVQEDFRSSILSYANRERMTMRLIGIDGAEPHFD